MIDGSFRNVFKLPSVAAGYDDFYREALGKQIDRIEKELIGRHLQNLPDDKLLELGCGTGHWSEFFSQQGFQITAIDISEAMLEIAKGKRIKNVVFQKADAGQLPFPNNRFPIVVSLTMLEFVEDVNLVLEEIDRVLAPGGTLIIGCLNIRSEIGKNKEHDPVFRYGRFFTPEAVTQLLCRFGEPSIFTGVYLSSGFKLLDGTPEQDTVHPAFIAASVKKTKDHGNYR